MPLARWFDQATPLPGGRQAAGLRVSAEQWLEAAEAVAAQGGRLLSMWAHGPIGGDASVLAALLTARGLLLLELPLDARLRASAGSHYPGLQRLFPAANRLQRAIADLAGLRSADPDRRAWLRHAGWPQGFCPLRDPDGPAPAAPLTTSAGAALESAAYEFVRVQGEGVHEIPVGPVHAGVIEPGHFRFSVVGEKVLRLEERLGYVHKGIERRFTELSMTEGHRLAARICGDCAVAFSWAYCQALEALAGVRPPDGAVWRRALALELERMANHLGDLGALGNDAGLAFALAQFSRLKELLLRACERALGQRYLLDFIVPGGTRTGLGAQAADALLATVSRIADESSTLQDILAQHEGVRDRFTGAGVISPALASRLGLLGLAARASGQGLDLRLDLPWEPYERLSVERCVRTEGDVAARVAVRFAELQDCCRLVRQILPHATGDAGNVALGPVAQGVLGIGLIEGWRGPVMIALEGETNARIRRCHPHDCSWQNWPALEHAIVDNIVPDFPLINKSFNLSYSGQDL